MISRNFSETKLIIQNYEYQFELNNRYYDDCIGKYAGLSVEYDWYGYPIIGGRKILSSYIHENECPVIKMRKERLDICIRDDIPLDNIVSAYHLRWYKLTLADIQRLKITHLSHYNWQHLSEFDKSRLTNMKPSHEYRLIDYVNKGPHKFMIEICVNRDRYKFMVEMIFKYVKN
jgi:hypothetical protein